jgi:large subunit ribosomal protein L9
MNVILLEKMGNLGGIGDQADVKAGFARNFLFPQGKAIPATKQNMEEFEGRRAELMAAHDANVAAAQKRAEKVNGVELRMEVNSSDEGRLFGSIGTREIADAVNSPGGSELTKAEVLLPNGAIRDLGHYEVALDLGFEVGASIKLAVVAIGATDDVSADGSLIDEIDAEAAAADAEDEAPAEPAE